MADFPVSSNSPGGKRPRLRAPRIDFTPMVDLGFLLITFFMLSTSLNKPNIMPLVMPDTEGKPEPTKESRALTLLLGANDMVYWYEGMDMEHIDSTSFDRDGLRQVVLGKMDKLRGQFGLQQYQDPKSGEARQGSFINVMIKPSRDSRYKNLVDALDEMNICHVRYYCVLDPSETELTALQMPNR